MDDRAQNSPSLPFAAQDTFDIADPTRMQDTPAIFVAQLNAIFVALKFQQAAISSRFQCSFSVKTRRMSTSETKAVRLQKSENATQSHRVS